MKPVYFGTMSSFYISFPYVLIQLRVHQGFLLNCHLGFSMDKYFQVAVDLHQYHR